jgi:hypothetical protein
MPLLGGKKKRSAAKPKKSSDSAKKYHYYAIVNAQGKELGDHKLKNSRPANAAKKAAKIIHGRKEGKLKVYVKNISRKSRSFGKVHGYMATLKFVKAPPFRKQFSKDGKILEVVTKPL